jgi:hypothetical protein
MAAPPPAAARRGRARRSKSRNDAELDELIGRFEALGESDRQLVLEFIRRLSTD